MTSESSNSASNEAGDLCRRIEAGDDDAQAELFDLTYDELRNIAHGLFKAQRTDHTLEPTAVVHEAFLKMFGAGRSPRVNDSKHFYCIAAKAMRQVLVNYARDRKALKRGGPEQGERVTLSLAANAAQSEGDVLAIHEAIERLSELDERQGQIAELRVFCGLQHPEIAEALGVAQRTVELDWSMAKKYLAGQLLGEE